MIRAKPGRLPAVSDSYLFRREDLVTVSDWLASKRASGAIIDFRIAPPSLEDIYIATVAGTAHPAGIAVAAGATA